jgi:DNA-binding transcriptional MocR family regulator
MTAPDLTAPDANDPRKHRQIYAAIRQSIDSGAIRPGQPLPSIAALSARHQVARQTAAKALMAAVADGIAIRYPGFGYYLAGPRDQAIGQGLLLPDAPGPDLPGTSDGPPAPTAVPDRAHSGEAQVPRASPMTNDAPTALTAALDRAHGGPAQVPPGIPDD